MNNIFYNLIMVGVLVLLAQLIFIQKAHVQS